MKNTATVFMICICLSANAQVINEDYNQERNKGLFSHENEIVATETNISIITKVIYNSIPDGYHLTYTTAFIGKTVEEVEAKMTKKIDSLTNKISEFHISKKDVVVDVVSLDPIFDFNMDDQTPIGYKVVENITFNIKNIAQVRDVSKACLDFKIYDLINAQAYCLNSKNIYDSLANKTVQILNMKKKLCNDIGWTFSDGKPSLTKFKDVFYPNEHYLNSYIRNASLYKHHISQNSTLNMERTVNVDNHYSLNLKDADFVFNSNSTGPVIQFYYQLNYGFTKKDTEAEMREKIRKEEEKKHEKTFYIIDKAGNLKKVDI